MGGAIWSLAGSVIARGLVFAAAVLAGRLLGVELFGQFAMVQITVEVALIGGNLGLALTATRFVAAYRDAPDTAGRYVGVTLIGSALIGLVASGILFSAAPFIAGYVLGTPTLAGALRWAAPVVAFGSVNVTLLAVLSGLEDFRAVALLSAARGTVDAGFLVLGLALGGVEGGLAGWALGEAVSLPLLFGVTRRSCYGKSIRICLRGLSDQWPVVRGFGLPSALGAGSIFGAAWLARAMLATSPDGFIELGLFSAAFRWVAVLLFVPLAAGGIFTPILAHSFGRGNAVLFRRLFLWHLALGVLVVAVPAAGMAVAAAPLMGAFGAEYVKGSAVLVVLTLSAIPTTVNNIVGQALVGAGLIWWRFLFDLAIAAVLISGALILVPTMQAIGLAIAYVLAFSVVSVAMIIIVVLRWRDSLLPRTALYNIGLDTETVA